MPRNSLDGQRLHIILPKVKAKELFQLADRTGITVSEHIRRAIDIYLSRLVEKK